VQNSNGGDFVANAHDVISAMKQAGIPLAPSELTKRALCFHPKGDSSTAFLTGIKGVVLREGTDLDLFLSNTFYLPSYGAVAVLTFSPTRGWTIGRDLPMSKPAKVIEIDVTLC